MPMSRKGMSCSRTCERRSESLSWQPGQTSIFLIMFTHFSRVGTKVRSLLRGVLIEPALANRSRGRPNRLTRRIGAVSSAAGIPRKGMTRSVCFATSGSEGRTSKDRPIRESLLAQKQVLIAAFITTPIRASLPTTMAWLNEFRNRLQVIRLLYIPS
jgi:hypothetical protein